MRLRSKRYAALSCFAALALMVGVTACGGSSSTSESSSEGDGGSSTTVESTGVTLGYIPIAIENPIVKAMAEAVKIKAEALGMDYKEFGGPFDPQAQINAVRAASAANVDILAIFPVDPNAVRGALDQIKAGGTPVIVHASPEIEDVVTNIETDDRAAGEEIAKYAAEKLEEEGKPCKVGIIQGLEVAHVLHERNVGLEQGAKDAGCEILEKQVNQDDSAAGARPIASAWGTKHGADMTAILAYNDPSALGAIAARNGDFMPVVTGMNGDQEGLEAVEDGRMLATQFEPVVEMGATVAQLAYDSVINEEEVPAEVINRYQLLTKDTIEGHRTLEEELSSPMAITITQEGDQYVVSGKNE